jgi:hypothetical protein
VTRSAYRYRYVRRVAGDAVGIPISEAGQGVSRREVGG